MMPTKLHAFSVCIFIFLLSACAGNEIKDYTSLKQKALEIPPDFELTPPSKEEQEVEAMQDAEEDANDIEDILIQNSNSQSRNETQSNSVDEFINENFNSNIEEVENPVEIE